MHLCSNKQERGWFRQEGIKPCQCTAWWDFDQTHFCHSAGKSASQSSKCVARPSAKTLMFIQTCISSEENERYSNHPPSCPFAPWRIRWQTPFSDKRSQKTHAAASVSSYSPKYNIIYFFWYRPCILSFPNAISFLLHPSRALLTTYWATPEPACNTTWPSHFLFITNISIWICRKFK